MSVVTKILEEVNQGDRRAAERLLSAVYDELRRLAARKLAHERPGQTLQATDLVHEAYLRLLGGAGLALGEQCPFLLSRRGGHAAYPDRGGSAKSPH